MHTWWSTGTRATKRQYGPPRIKYTPIWWILQ